MASTKRSDGEGSVYYRAERARWIGEVIVGWRDGKPVRRRVSADTEKGARKKVNDLLRANQPLTTGKPMTVKAWMTHWITKVAPRRVGELTLAGYRDKTDHYIIPLLGHYRLDKLTAEHIEAAWEHLATVGNPTREHPTPLAPASILQTHAILRRALKVAMQRKHIATNPAASDSMDAPSNPTKEMTPLTTAEARQVLAATKDLRNGARYVLALSLGLRRGEALGLTWDHVDLDNGVIQIRQAVARIKGEGLKVRGLKSASARRDLALPPQLVKILKAHRKAQNVERLAAGDLYDPRGFVFAQPDGKPIDPSKDTKRWKALLAEAGVPHRRLHDARHTAATMLLLQGVDVRVAMQILGHSQVSMTMRYQHVVDDMQRDAVNRIGDALWGPSGEAKSG